MASMKVSPIPCPIRCFLQDVPDMIDRSQHSKSETNATFRLQLRLLGTVIDVKNAAEVDRNATYCNLDQASDSNDTLSAASSVGDTTNSMMMAITLDDGTATVTIYATRSMTNQISVTCGMILDCIVCVVGSSDNPSFMLSADQLVVVEDEHAETLRWLEIAFRESLKNQPNGSNTTCEFGFPVRMFNADDLYHVILSDYEACRDFKQNEDAGVSLADLSLVLDIPANDLQTMLEELQLSGQIYCNQKGLYLPL